MLFPEIRSAVKGFFSGFDSEPVSLDIEKKAVMPFDLVAADWYARNGFQRLAALTAGGLPAWSGEQVSTASAMNHSVVWACNRIISESVGFIPALLMQENDGAKREATEHPMYSALKNAPNDEITAQGFTEMETSHCVLEGNAYAHIIRRSSNGTAVELRGIAPECVKPDREKSGQKRLIYVIKSGNDPEKTYTVVPGKPHDILHLRGLGWDGIRGYSVISMARQSIGTALAMEHNVGRFYASGGRLPYYLKLAQKFKTDADFDKFRNDWEATYGQPHKAPILEPNIAEYKQIGLSMVDQQLIESRQFTIPEICRWFSVSPHLVGDLSRATFANIEQLSLDFVRQTLMAWLTRWEQELWRCVLTPEEKAAGYIFKHNDKPLLRGDFQSRMMGYATMLQNGVSSINEVRNLEDQNPIDGGDDHYIQLNLRDVSQPAPAQPARVKVEGSKEQAA